MSICYCNKRKPCYKDVYLQYYELLSYIVLFYVKFIYFVDMHI